MENDTDEDFARKVKGRIEKTTLSEVCQYIEEVYTECDCILVVKLDIDRIKLLQLEVDIDTIVHKLVLAIFWRFYFRVKLFVL